jgi:hypothetical protein
MAKQRYYLDTRVLTAFFFAAMPFVAFGSFIVVNQARNQLRDAAGVSLEQRAVQTKLALEQYLGEQVSTSGPALTPVKGGRSCPSPEAKPVDGGLGLGKVSSTPRCSGTAGALLDPSPRPASQDSPGSTGRLRAASSREAALLRPPGFKGGNPARHPGCGRDARRIDRTSQVARAKPEDVLGGADAGDADLY